MLSTQLTHESWTQKQPLETWNTKILWAQHENNADCEKINISLHAQCGVLRTVSNNSVRARKNITFDAITTLSSYKRERTKQKYRYINEIKFDLIVISSRIRCNIYATGL